MNHFSADIAGLLAIALFAGGLITLHFGKVHKANLMKLAAWIMMIGGVAGILCTSHFWFKYYYQGSLEYPNVVMIKKITTENLKSSDKETLNETHISRRNKNGYGF